LISLCLYLYPTKQIQKEIKKVYELDLIDTFFTGELEDIEAEIRMGEKAALARLKSDYHHTLITDVIKDIEWWACFKPEKKVKIGRNEPCPCGSGKKYKKCCGR
jgi:uncharacterized protein YchJ